MHLGRSFRLPTTLLPVLQRIDTDAKERGDVADARSPMLWPAECHGGNVVVFEHD